MASSVPSERLFSSSGQTADDQQAHLGPVHFEQAQIIKSVWKEGAIDLAKVNQNTIEEVYLDEFREYLKQDEEAAELDGLTT